DIQSMYCSVMMVMMTPWIPAALQDALGCAKARGASSSKSRAVLGTPLVPHSKDSSWKILDLHLLRPGRRPTIVGSWYP
ncbi:hypothetical protein NL500_30815, partial [Klebsiella pneumoniae]|nr:hypothetical protein [Klebsiella pneumoniae]